MDKTVLADDMVSGLMSSFRTDNVVLFAGRKWNAEKMREICHLPWSCVVTSRRDGDFGTEFPEEVHPHRYVKFKELPSVLFNRTSLPVIQLFGNENIQDDQFNEIEDELMREMYIEDEAKRIMNYGMARMDIRSKFVIVGYDPEDPKEFPVRQMVLSWKDMRGARVELYGGGQGKEMEFLEKEICKRDGVWTEEKLCDILSRRQKLDAEYAELDQEAQNVFYKGGKPVMISKSILLLNRNFMQLLTDELIYENRPLGRIEQAKWFYNFLNYSSEEPQWYGYLPQSVFYVKRECEDVLVQLVRNLLNGKMRPEKINTPVILQGDPGSSKSIELAALAYRIYQEKNNPVIYIKSDNLSFGEQSAEFERLDELMQEVENIGEKDVRFLIIWDSSSYKKVIENAENLIRCLENRGRRIVLVCTAYRGVDKQWNENNGKSANDNNKGLEREKWYWFKREEGVFVKSNTKQGDVFFDGKDYFVYSDRNLTEQEYVKLKQNAKSYSVAPKEQLDRIWKKLDGDRDAFTYFYHLMVALRPKLDNNLTREQKLVDEYVVKQLADIGTDEQKEESGNVMIEALRNAGIELEECDREILEQDDLSGKYDLKRFNTCIAMFSRFKLDTPYSLAIRMISKDEDDFFESGRNYGNRELFKLLTTQIPYIHYYEAEEGRFVFRYRNKIEAGMFLQRNGIEPEEQVDLICSIMDFYAESYRRLGDTDLELKTVIEKFLRLIGPNTDYTDFLLEESRAEHENFMKNMEKIIHKLQDLRMKDRIPDEDAGFANIEITFIREYYGKMWDVLNGYNRRTAAGFQPWDAYPDVYTDVSYVKRLKQMKSALDYALENIEYLQKNIVLIENAFEKKGVIDQLNTLTVEACLCSRSLEDIWKEYQEFCRGKNTETSLTDMNVKSLTYKYQYEMLVKAVNRSPLNGYAYNALFNAFEREYEKSDEVRKLQLLSEIRMIADDVSTLPVTNRGMNGMDELTNHLGKIAEYSCNHRITIAEIEDSNVNNPFQRIFDEMLNQNNPSAICFVCQQELNKVYLDGKSIAERQMEGEEYKLNREQLDVCKKIVDFMMKEEYSSCISANQYALYLLLRVEWMLYNGHPLFAGNEKQLTYLQPDEWKEINRICEMYELCPGASKRPIVTLIYALSEIQLGRDNKAYKNAVSIISRLSEETFYSTPRMRVPYLICFEPGIPKLYTGTVLSTKNYTGFIRYDGVPERLGGNVGIRFYMKNLGLKKMPQPKSILKDLELGLGYTGLSAYRKVSDGGDR